MEVADRSRKRIQMVGDPDRLSRLIDNPSEIDNPVLANFLDHWSKKRGERVLPDHADFVPRDAGKHLPWIVSTDALADYRDFRYRVVGSNVCRYFGIDGTGKTVSEAFARHPPQVGKWTLEIFRRTCRGGSPLRLTTPAGRWNDIVFPDFDALYLPYGKDSATADRVITVFTFNYRQLVEAR
jgi:hypothetical protein